jgi:pimeloyl-ACP methyl ester carboxylesterase
VEDLRHLLEQQQHKKLILVGHSLGCALIPFLYPYFRFRVNYVVLISAKAELSEKDLKNIRTIRTMPDVIFNLVRYFDRWGGLYSPSVNRMLTAHADEPLRKKQLKWNKTSRTFVYKRMLLGLVLPTKVDYEKIVCPILLLHGEEVCLVY